MRSRQRFFIIDGKVCGWNYATAAKEVDKLIGNLPVIHYRDDLQPLPNRNALRSMWKESRPVEQGDEIAKYLVGRGIVDHRTTVFRYIHRENNPDAWRCSPISMESHRRCIGRFLLGEGKKVRKFMPGKIAKGGAVSLAPFTDRVRNCRGD